MLLMDLSMSIMDGFETTTRIRKYEQKFGIKPTPIIAMSASASDSWTVRDEEAGIDDFVTKPLNLECIEEVIRRFIFVDKEQPYPPK